MCRPGSFLVDCAGTIENVWFLFFSLEDLRQANSLPSLSRTAADSKKVKSISVILVYALNLLFPLTNLL